MAKSKKKSKKHSVKSVMTRKSTCGCGPAKVARIRNSEGGGAHGMCRDVNGVTRKKNGRKRQPGTFSKAAHC